jgi:hypothetical protein
MLIAGGVSIHSGINVNHERRPFPAHSTRLLGSITAAYARGGLRP